jgi:hypothetical protein
LDADHPEMGVLFARRFTAWRRQQELDLQIALRPALAATKGLAAPDVGETIARARALAEQIDRAEYIVPLLFGQWQFHVFRSEHNLALSVAAQIEQIGEARSDLMVQLLSRGLNGMSRCYLGEFVAARALLEQTHGLSDPAPLIIGAGLTGEPHAAMLAHLAVCLAYLGHVDQARSCLDSALSEAHCFKHTLAVVLALGFWIESLTRSPKIQWYADELLALSTEHGFPYYLGIAIASRGSLMTELGLAQEGFSQLKEGLSMVRATGAILRTSRTLVRLAEAYSTLGRAAEAMTSLSEAAQIIETTEERVSEAELHRVRIPTKPARSSDLKPATRTDLKPATVPR